MARFNAEFAVGAAVKGSAFVPWLGGALEDILCQQYEHIVGAEFAMLSGQVYLRR